MQKRETDRVATDTVDNRDGVEPDTDRVEAGYGRRSATAETTVTICVWSGRQTGSGRTVDNATEGEREGEREGARSSVTGGVRAVWKSVRKTI